VASSRTLQLVHENATARTSTTAWIALAMAGALPGLDAAPPDSIDSVLSNYSGVDLWRLGPGDKMLDFALNRGMPLIAMSTSLPDCFAGSDQLRND